MENPHESTKFRNEGVISGRRPFHKGLGAFAFFPVGRRNPSPWDGACSLHTSLVPWPVWLVKVERWCVQTTSSDGTMWITPAIKAAAISIGQPVLAGAELVLTSQPRLQRLLLMEILYTVYNHTKSDHTWTTSSFSVSVLWWSEGLRYLTSVTTDCSGSACVPKS